MYMRNYLTQTRKYITKQQTRVVDLRRNNKNKSKRHDNMIHEDNKRSFAGPYSISRLLLPVIIPSFSLLLVVVSAFTL